MPERRASQPDGSTATSESMPSPGIRGESDLRSRSSPLSTRRRARGRISYHLLNWEREAGRIDERFGAARKALKSGRASAENHDFGSSFFGSMNGFLTTTAVRNPAGVTISISVPSFER